MEFSAPSNELASSHGIKKVGVLDKKDTDAGRIIFELRSEGATSVSQHGQEIFWIRIKDEGLVRDVTEYDLRDIINSPQL